MLRSKIIQRAQEIKEEARKNRLESLGIKYGVSFEGVFLNMILSIVKEQYFDDDALAVMSVDVELDDIKAWIAQASNYNAAVSSEEIDEENLVETHDGCIWEMGDSSIWISSARARHTITDPEELTEDEVKLIFDALGLSWVSLSSTSCVQFRIYVVSMEEDGAQDE